MRLVETCSCGARLEVVWDEPKFTRAHSGEYRESERSRTELATFRKNHKQCRTQPIAAADGQPAGDT